VSYEPREGTGWVEGNSPIEGVRRWRLLLEWGVHLQVTVGDVVFFVSRVTGNEHSVPMPEDVGRVERDFGVRGWSIQGVMSVVPPSTGQTLSLVAVEAGV